MNIDPASAAVFAATSIVSVVAYLLTSPLDLRPVRWPCIMMSIPLVVITAQAFTRPIDPSGGIAAILSMGALGYVWKSVFAHYAGEGVVNLMIGNLNARSGITPDLRLPKWHRKEGRLEQAIAELKAELEKDECDFEALVLLADLHEEKNDIISAHAALEKLFNSERLIGVQIDIIEARKTQLAQKILIEKLNSKR